jgi:acetyl-CoA carboxylase biotin carboxylase subunit
MFRKVLIANRGEIACRIARTLHALDIEAVAVYSEADAEAPHVKVADEAYPIGPPPVVQSYLNVDAILDAAHKAKADAIHPGYGLLSERAEFAEACEKRGLVFIGPHASAMRAMGSKLSAREVMQEAGVPIVPGGTTPVGDPDDAGALARALGFPVLVKASGGGGGIGMQLARDEGTLHEAIESCRRLAERFFSDATVYIEKYVMEPRHVEIQVLGDRDGNVVAVHERECSVQRRHQKVIEEAPSMAVDDALRERMVESAVLGARKIAYTNAGTFEFVLDDQDNYYFLEMNTRLQVEHPVTEAITGLDLVAEQLHVANGGQVRFASAPPINGHAIECRIYAEDPKRFLPSPGKIERLRWPESDNVRIDSGVAEGYTVTPYYDPMLAKLIAWAPTRERAIDEAHAALTQTTIEGVKTNISLLLAVLRHPDFAAGCYTTELLSSGKVLG